MNLLTNQKIVLSNQHDHQVKTIRNLNVDICLQYATCRIALMDVMLNEKLLMERLALQQAFHIG